MPGKRDDPMFDMDSVTALGVLGAAAAARLQRFDRWRPGDRLKILLAGYNGKRNTGADVRVAAMVEQFRNVLGPDRVDIGILTLEAANIRGYFPPDVRLIEFSSIFFKDLLDACSDHHMAVLCEGSCLKSKFANALTLFFCEAAGVMRNQGKPCIAYGSEAGYMDPLIRRVATDMCKETYFIARTEPSLRIIREMGLRGDLGTDTAWTFPPAPPEWARRELADKLGWKNGEPLLGLAVINPFCWPVKPSLTRWARAAATRNWDHHYEKWYFFSASQERTRAYRRYIEGVAAAADRFATVHGARVAVIGMEALDLGPCNDVRRALRAPSAVFSSRDYDGYQMTALLHALDALVTSRYHARVLSMPACVPSIAVSMDERLHNLFEECGHLADYYLSTDDPDLADKLPRAMDKLWEDRESVAREIGRSVPRYVDMMAAMGRLFRDFVERSFPGIELDPPPSGAKAYLPSLYPALERLVGASS